MERRVVVTGIGVISPLGDSPVALHTALCAGQSGLQPITLFDTDGLVCKQAHALAAFTPETYLEKKNLRALDRTSRLVTVAAKLALEQSGWSTEMRQQHEVGLVLGTMFCSVHTISEFDRRGLTLGPTCVSPMDFANTVINAAAGQAAIWHDLRGVNSTIAGGITSGLHALAYATELIRSGQAAALLAGGAEELCFESFCGFDRAGLLCGSRHDTREFPIPFDARRNGFTLGEGAALLMLEDAALATERGAHVIAEITGHGSAYDLARGTESQQAVAAIARAMRLALQDAQMDPSDIACLSASANGSVLADRHEAQAIATVFKEGARDLPVTAVKSMLGETLGASGALQTVALLAAMHDDVLPGIWHLEQVEEDFPLYRIGPCNQHVPLRNGLINSVGLDGNCCSLVITQNNSSQ
jgi:3-oxoacyl-[acyl-carrier-protein] synthase II